jgi:hypothetical protein
MVDPAVLCGRSDGCIASTSQGRVTEGNAAPEIPRSGKMIPLWRIRVPRGLVKAENDDKGLGRSG